MFDINEAVKKDFESLSKEDQEYVYSTFMRYVVRKEIADQNQQLSKLFGRAEQNTGRHISHVSEYFNLFNSMFINCGNLIDYLSYEESHTLFLKERSQEVFDYLVEDASSFERKMALICYSKREHERIPNRVNFDVMVAYANMQKRVLELVKTPSAININIAIKNAAKEVRAEFENKHGHKIEETEVSKTCENFKKPGKKTCTVWINMLQQYIKDVQRMSYRVVTDVIKTKFTPTKNAEEKFRKEINEAEDKTNAFINEKKAELESRNYKNPYEYEEVYSRGYRDETLSEYTGEVLTHYLNAYLKEIQEILLGKEQK